MLSPRSDQKSYRAALGQFATGVTIISCAVDGKLAAVTANSFSSVSMDPPLVLWSIANTSTSFRLFTESSHFAVTILADCQIELATKFAKSGGDKFEGVDWRPGRYGSPIVGGGLMTFECRKETMYQAGDHTILIGEVELYSGSEGKPLLFANGRFGCVANGRCVA